MSNKVYTSTQEWEREYFPKKFQQKQFEKIQDDPKRVGIMLAEESLRQVKERINVATE